MNEYSYNYTSIKLHYCYVVEVVDGAVTSPVFRFPSLHFSTFPALPDAHTNHNSH